MNTLLTLSPAEVAAMIGLSEKTVLRRVQEGKIPKLAGIGKRVRISREYVLRLISNGRS